MPSTKKPKWTGVKEMAKDVLKISEPALYATIKGQAFPHLHFGEDGSKGVIRIPLYQYEQYERGEWVPSPLHFYETGKCKTCSPRKFAFSDPVKTQEEIKGFGY